MQIFEFFKRQLQVAQILGIPVKIDYRWFFVFILLIWITASNIPSSVVPEAWIKIIFGVIVTAFFFASIFLHELAHAVAARLENIETREIVLHPFGGYARLSREPDTPKGEFRIAIAGPTASFLLGIIFLLLTLLTNSLGAQTAFSGFFLLFFGNILLAVFNLFPGYPLDGGRVLRAYLRQQGYELNEATRLSGRCGQIMSLALMIFGVFLIITGKDLFTSVWTIMVGVFLLDSATTIVKHSELMKTVTVGEVMGSPKFVQPERTIQQFVDHTVALLGQEVYLVARDKRLHGVVLLEDIKPIPKQHWREKKISEVMRPVTDEYFVSADVLLSDAQNMMNENGIGTLGVLDRQGLLVGSIQRGKIRRRRA